MTSSTSRNPHELVDRYLQAVRFWLPKSHRQEDLLAELGEDLRSQIDEKETELGRPLSADEISDILKRCGSPAVVGSRLGPSRYLIGPVLYPTYDFVLKMVLFWILVPVFVFILGPINLANAAGNWSAAIGTTFADLWSALFIAAGIVTLVFAIVERTSVHMGAVSKWDPLKLPPVRKTEAKTSLAHKVSELIFSCFGLTWLLLLPQHPFLILGPASAFLKPAPIWHIFYLPIVLLAVAAILRPAIILARPQWTWFPLSSQLLQTVLSLILLHFVIEAAGQTHGASWFPFVALAESARDSVQYPKIAAIVNVSILVSLVCAWIGLCIGGGVQTWQLMKYIRKQVGRERLPASLPVR